MNVKRFPKVAIGFFLLITCMPLVFWHCDRHENIVGKYQSIAIGPQGKTAATLELQTNGKGMWFIETDNAPFRWTLHQKTIRLHTQAGGIIEGIIESERIRIDMPGTGIILFERLD